LPPVRAKHKRVIRVLIVGDIRLYREGLAEILGRRREISVVATASASAEALAIAATVVSDVILLDMAMSGSLDMVRELCARAPATNIVALGVPELERDVIACAEAGVAGYVTREDSIAETLEVIQSAARGEALCSPAMTATLLRHIATMAAERPSAHSPLTSRELEVVRLIDDGLSNKQIAQQLCIEIATVKNHVHNILEKLRVQRRSEAAAHVRAQLDAHHRRPAATAN
jgi:two-component system nitrate/nitrite response regulator NarL